MSGKDVCISVSYASKIYKLALYCLALCLRNFPLSRDVDITNEGLQNLEFCCSLRAAFEQREGSLQCHIRYDKSHI